MFRYESVVRIGCRAFVMIDEPTEGLTPMIVQQVGDLIDEIAQRGVPNLLVEQNLSIAMRISYRTYVMGNGRIVFEGGTQFTENRNTAKLSISFRVD